MSIIINPDKAKNIWKDKWRETRRLLLAQLDIEFIKAIENGDIQKQTEIAAKKQTLRDITKIEINTNIPEEIKQIWPEILGKNPII